MKYLKKLTAVCLAVICLCACCSQAVFASGENDEWTRTRLEQYGTTMPEVNAYFYPMRDDGSIYYGKLPAANSISATLGGEELKVKSLERIEDVGTTYILVVDITDNGSGLDYLKALREELKYWIETMRDQDKMVLLTCAEEIKLVLNGSESRDDAVEALMKKGDFYKVEHADMVKGLKKAIEIAESDDSKLPERRVVVLFDKGRFLLDRKDNAIEELKFSLNKASLPVFALSNDLYWDGREAMADFAESTGGKGYETTVKDLRSVIGDLRSWMDSCFVLRMEAANNDPEPAERSLMIDFGEGKDVNVEKEIRIEGYLPDDTSPEVVDLTVSGRTIAIEFSENVQGADKVSAYKIGHLFKKAVIKSVKYDANDYTAVLTLEKEITDGKYTLGITGVKDCSVERNALEFPEDSDEYSFIVGKGNRGLYIIFGACAGAAILLVVLLLVLLRKKPEPAEPVPVQTPAEPETLKVNMTVTLPNGSKSHVELTIGENFKVGRKEDCALVINESTISGLHCILNYANGKLIITDINSRNGTFINGERVTAPSQIKNGDQILLGKTQINIMY